jgi:xylose isomerase
MIYKGKKEAYPGIGKIEYEGKKSKNPLAFRWYDPEPTGIHSVVMAAILSVMQPVFIHGKT